VYANSAQLEVTPWDFTLIFGEIQRYGPSPSEARIEQQVAVVMSPQHAKALLGILSGNVAEYEQRVGEIRLLQQATEAKSK
jgi:hypothetical protein